MNSSEFVPSFSLSVVKEVANFPCSKENVLLLFL
jgi:hypothetical protein